MEAEHLILRQLKASVDFQEVQIKALHRAINALINMLKHHKVINANEESWIDTIKRDVKLAVAIDNENLLQKVLDIASKVPCPKSSEAAVAAIRSHDIQGASTATPRKRPF